MTQRVPMIIAVRGYAVVQRDDDEKDTKPDESGPKQRKTLPRPSKWIVAFDTETSNDHAQYVRIGSYQVRKGMALDRRGVFYDAANLKPDDLSLLQAHVTARGLELITKEDFERYVLYRYGYERGGLILGFNLPFDLSRLATATPTSKSKEMRGGFSLDLVPEKWRPNILVRNLNSRAAFMRFAVHRGPVDARSMRKKFKTQAKTGYFQDVKTLGAALLGRS